MKAKDETLDVMMPVRFVVQFDDATGAAISGQDINGAGDVLMGFAATEVKANSGLDKKLFAYTPPEGAKVHDETQEAEKATLPKMPEPEKKAP